jgi:hypothetical protein
VCAYQPVERTSAPSNASPRDAGDRADNAQLASICAELRWQRACEATCTPAEPILAAFKGDNSRCPSENAAACGNSDRRWPRKAVGAGDVRTARLHNEQFVVIAEGLTSYELDRAGLAAHACAGLRSPRTEKYQFANIDIELAGSAAAEVKAAPTEAVTATFSGHRRSIDTTPEYGRT